MRSVVCSYVAGKGVSSEKDDPTPKTAGGAALECSGPAWMG